MKNLLGFFFMGALILFQFWSCAPEENGPIFDPLAPPTGETRQWLTVKQLIAHFPIQETHNGYFLPIGKIESAEDFSGTVSFSETKMITDYPDSNWEGSGYTIFPGFSIEMMSYKGRLLPVTQKLIYPDLKSASGWRIAISPGRVWHENGDGDYSRAAFPFILTSAGVGQARNGVATFVYKGSEISSVFIQISQETAPRSDYSHNNFVATIDASYKRHPLNDSQSLVLSFERSSAAMLSVRPWSDLPQSSLLQALFNSGHSEVDISAAAILLDKTIYRQESYTRCGPYPFPDEMRHGVYSVTKSICASIAMFWLAQRYGEDVFDLQIAEYVPALSNHSGWQGVTFAHALNMVTGTMGSDEGQLIMPFIKARSAAEKIAAVAQLPDDNADPGELFRYLSTNTFALSYAINEYVKKREGQQADYWDMIVHEVFEPIGVYELLVSRTEEHDGSVGIPLLCWGSYPNLDELAKISMLLLNEGVHNGQILLSDKRVREGVFPYYWRGFVNFYKHSFWWENIAISNCNIFVPYMSGRGGNSVVFSPNGLVLILFSDDMNYEITPLLRAAEKIRSFCD